MLIYNKILIILNIFLKFVGIKLRIAYRLIIQSKKRRVETHEYINN